MSRRVLTTLPSASVSEDNDGQVVINTRLHRIAGAADLFGAPEEGGRDELFIVSRLSRGSIAEEINATLDRDAEDDTRLTGEIVTAMPAGTATHWQTARATTTDRKK